MSWAVVSACISNSVDLPSEVMPSAAEVLIAMGWTPPPEPPEVHQVHRSSQDPNPGPFLLPKEGP